eukprot:EG_transcript_17907
MGAVCPHLIFILAAALLPSSVIFEAEAKVLLYSSLGAYSWEYLKMTQLMLQTYKATAIHETEIVLICHQSWAKETASGLRQAHRVLLLSDSAYQQVRPARRDPRPRDGRFWGKSQAAANKLRIFELLPSIYNYSVVVMLDVDIVVLREFLSALGRIRNKVLYVAAEGGHFQANWRGRDYTPAELSALRRKHLHPFNTGQFVFRPSAHIQSLFLEAYQSYLHNPLFSIYEQGHLNTAFLLKGTLNYGLTRLVRLEAHDYSVAELKRYALAHFCHNNRSAAWKLQQMQRLLAALNRPTSVPVP